jgi:benzoyl-CoA reductase/2-hydroxyglutaryl-CoA dehydratase subunit BcrC/BadD/HgdB
LAHSYSRYTYPYGIFRRIEDIQLAVQERSLDGIVHYVQSFCFRGIEDIALRSAMTVPVLTLQGDLPTRVTETMEIRIEAFVDMLVRRKEKQGGEPLSRQ